VASRLSEDPTVTVLLIEAGGDGSVITDVPSFVGLAQGTNFDWKYK